MPGTAKTLGGFCWTDRQPEGKKKGALTMGRLETLSLITPKKIGAREG